MFAAVIPGPTGNTFILEPGLLGHTLGSFIVRVNDQPDAIPVLALEQITGHENDGLRCEPLASILASVDVVGELKFIQVLDGREVFDVA
jgi:hypothetical protein